MAIYSMVTWSFTSGFFNVKVNYTDQCSVKDHILDVQEFTVRNKNSVFKYITWLLLSATSIKQNLVK